MGSLLKITVFHLLRSRLLVGIVALTLAVQVVGIQLAKATVLHIQEQVRTVSETEAIVVGLVLQMLLGILLAIAYGVWVAPYAHRQKRGELTFLLPISKWYFPLAYAVIFALLLLVQHGILLFCCGWIFGPDVLAFNRFPWTGFFLAFVIQVIAMAALVFACAACSLSLGSALTFFLAVAVGFVIVVVRGFFSVDMGRFFGAVPDWFVLGKKAVFLLPPLNQLPSQLRQTFLTTRVDWASLGVHCLWLAVFLAWFRYRIGNPLLTSPDFES